MDAFDFIKDCQKKCANGKAIRASFQPKKGAKARAHAKVGFPEYGMSSVPGEHFGSPSTPASTGPVDMGISTVGTCGPVEAVAPTGVDAVMESFEKEHPSSDVVSEIRKLLENVRKGNGVLYHGCDGAQATQMESANPAPIENSQISALAAACEASLNAFKNYTGFDYTALRK